MTRLFLLLILFCPVFFLFTYNSTYGYDALEYLVIARSLNEGYSLYDFIPSKSYLIYASTNVLLSLLGGYNHASVSGLIMLLAMGCVLSAWRAARQFGERAALITAALTAACCFFMEMNFLEPESWIGIFGLNAFLLATDGKEQSGWRWLGAGVLLGIAMCFKSVAAFYVVGFGAFILLLWLAGRLSFWPMVARGMLVLLGFLLPLSLSALYFYVTNRLDAHLEWTYIYPFGGYPSHTIFLVKFLIKLSWFLLLLAVSIVLMVRQPYRAAYQRTPALWLALLLAGFSCIAMLKTQASHYFFPAAVFFSVHLGFMADKWLGQYERRYTYVPYRSIFMGVGAVGILVLISAFLYRPDAIKRFVTVADYSGEKEAGDFIREQAGPNGKVLLFDNALSLYYLSDREPNVPFFFTEMQTTHYIKSHPDTYKHALADTSLKMVVFGNRSSVIDDSTALNNPANAYAIRQLRAGLQKNFVQVKNPRFPLLYWVRK
ncbi:glycosyltransferase family 39 protein [Spirosoma sp.]|uniref:glycosyltransferase family 39 protein n=1 Tax=Spirosoma sp. TaxID=1899569 RepID=UPI002614A172|nr:glycosyltransferase family 39 protein [Spirosoma sp.]MCX6215533.1 glycosyltransferase family 39 protein [Spirosoma sp.]